MSVSAERGGARIRGPAWGARNFRRKVQVMQERVKVDGDEQRGTCPHAFEVRSTLKNEQPHRQSNETILRFSLSLHVHCDGLPVAARGATYALPEPVLGAVPTSTRSIKYCGHKKCDGENISDLIRLHAHFAPQSGRWPPGSERLARNSDSKEQRTQDMYRQAFCSKSFRISIPPTTGFL